MSGRSVILAEDMNSHRWSKWTGKLKVNSISIKKILEEVSCVHAAMDSDAGGNYPVAPRSDLNNLLFLCRAPLHLMKVSAIVVPTTDRRFQPDSSDISKTIHKMGGPNLAQACAGLKRCMKGGARVTPGFDLPCANVIHTLVAGSVDDDSLEVTVRCYRNSLTVAGNTLGSDLKTIALPIFENHRLKLEQFCIILLKTIRIWLESVVDGGLMPNFAGVLVCVDDENALAELHKIAPVFFPRSDIEKDIYAGTTTTAAMEDAPLSSMASKADSGIFVGRSTRESSKNKVPEVVVENNPVIVPIAETFHGSIQLTFCKPNTAHADLDASRSSPVTSPLTSDSNPKISNESSTTAAVSITEKDGSKSVEPSSSSFVRPPLAVDPSLPPSVLREYERIMTAASPAASKRNTAAKKITFEPNLETSTSDDAHSKNMKKSKIVQETNVNSPVKNSSFRRASNTPSQAQTSTMVVKSLRSPSTTSVKEDSALLSGRVRLPSTNGETSSASDIRKVTPRVKSFANSSNKLFADNSSPELLAVSPDRKSALPRFDPSQIINHESATSTLAEPVSPDSDSVRVYLVGDDFGSRLLPLISSMTAGELLLSLSQKIDLRTPEVFALYLQYGTSADGMIEKMLRPDKNIRRELKRLTGFKVEWFKIVLRRALFAPSDLRDPFRDPMGIHLTYMQMVRDVIHGFFPVSMPDAIRLAGLQVYAELGRVDDTSGDASFLRSHIGRMIPVPLFRMRPSSFWEAEILKSHNKWEWAMQGATNIIDAEFAYLQQLKKYNYYGCSIFSVAPEKKSKLANSLGRSHDTLLLSVNYKGLGLLDPNTKDLLWFGPYSDIVKLSFTSREFILQTSPLIMKLGSTRAKHIFELIHAYMSLLAKNENEDYEDSFVDDEEQTSLSRKSSTLSNSSLGGFHDGDETGPCLDSLGVAQRFSVKCLLPNRQSIIATCSATNTVTEFKDQLMKQVKKMYRELRDSDLQLKTFSSEGFDDVPLLGDEVIADIHNVKEYLKRSQMPLLLLAPPESEDEFYALTKQELEMSEFVSLLIGESCWTPGDDEVFSFHRSMLRVKKEVKKGEEMKSVAGAKKWKMLVKERITGQSRQPWLKLLYHSEVGRISAAELEKKSWRELQYLPMTKLDSWPLRINIIGIQNLISLQLKKNSAVSVTKIDLFADKIKFKVSVEVAMYFGGRRISSIERTRFVRGNSNPRWSEWLELSTCELDGAVKPLMYANIPRESVLCLTTRVSVAEKGEDLRNAALGWANCQLVDFKSFFKSGLQTFKLWPDGEANPIGTRVENIADENPSMLYIEFERFLMPVVFVQDEIHPFTAEEISRNVQRLEYEGVSSTLDPRLLYLLNRDPLYELDLRDKELIWKSRYCLLDRPSSLPKLALSVDWADKDDVREMHRLLALWGQMKPIEALELLDPQFADGYLRDYAVKCLEKLSDVELPILQLTQGLKHEPYHDSSLVRFLMKRSFSSRAIGHEFYWQLKAELHVPEIAERFRLYLEVYLRGCGSHLEELLKQEDVKQKLAKLARTIRSSPKSEHKNIVLEGFSSMNLPKEFGLALSPEMKCNGIVIEKCKVMSSKKLPLWVVFRRVDTTVNDKLSIIFKCGDDLRQDQLTLQILRIMDRIWQSAGMDLRMLPYKCVSTGDEEGFLEVVTEADTLSNIAKEYAGLLSFDGVLHDDTIEKWLRKYNDASTWHTVVDNCVRSCAGYCVATYVLGLGDRHNDNVMIRKDGRFFHIDFGHFLGNVKYKAGFKRERAPFVFTKDLAYIMGGVGSPEYKRFEDMACQAYIVLRKHANMFINLFTMMLSTGIPELKKVKDVSYLVKAFALDLTDDQASAKFKEMISESLNSLATTFNFAVHIMAH